MTRRRWMRDDDDSDQGPAEVAVRAELEALGWTPLTPPGPLRTAAEVACSLAETLDRSQHATALPTLARQLMTVMEEARRVAQADETGLTANREEDVLDFQRARQQRRPSAGEQ
jgi:hypothetical protein